MTGQETIDMAFSANSLAAYDLQPFQANRLSAMGAADKVFMLNWALKVIGRKIHTYDPKVVFTLTADVAEYDLRNTAVFSRRVLRPYQVIINGAILRDASGHKGLWSLHELEGTNERWRTTTQRGSQRAVLYGTKLLLDYPPSAANVAGANNYVSGTVLPQIVTNDADATHGLPAQLDIEEDVHEIVPFFMAMKAAIPTTDEDNAWKRLTAYNGEWMETVTEIGRRNANLIAPWRSVEDEGEDYLCL